VHLHPGGLHTGLPVLLDRQAGFNRNLSVSEIIGSSGSPTGVGRDAPAAARHQQRGADGDGRAPAQLRQHLAALKLMIDEDAYGFRDAA